MAGYWLWVPRGTWKISDAEDALQALEDEESRAEYDSKANRINILGPDHKAIIIDLPFILEQLDPLSKLLFINEIEKLLDCHISIYN